MTRSIFVNTTGWLALYNPNDPNHDAVAQLWGDLRRAPGEPARFVCTDLAAYQALTTALIDDPRLGVARIVSHVTLRAIRRFGGYPESLLSHRPA